MACQHSDISSAIKATLYNYPPFHSNWIDKNEFNVLIVDYTKYTKSIVDYCLQFFQLLNRTLTITILSSNLSTVVSDYFNGREYLKEFVTVNDSRYGWKSHYEHAIIKLATIPQGALSPSSNADEILLQCADADCVFFTSPLTRMSNLLNQCVLAKDELNCQQVYYYVCDREDGVIRNDVVPIRINTDVHHTADILNMAFNTHLCWNGRRIYNVEEQLAHFNSKIGKYDRQSSIDFAYSIFYKLANFNIFVNEISVEEAARSFYALCSSTSPCDDILSTVAHLEHRRWLLSKVL